MSRIGKKPIPLPSGVKISVGEQLEVSGPKGKGTVYIEATKTMDVWNFEHIQLQVDGHPERIDLETGRPVLPPSPSDKQA